MAQVAPGLAPEHNEPPCYNCGIRGHMFTACPEEPRKVPAGLEASWARQQSSTSPHNDSPLPHNRRSKGPVITRYPPPPPPASSHHAPPMPRFDNSPPQPFQSGHIPVYPPPPLYGPGFGAHPPSHPPYDRYGPPNPPAPPGLPPIPPPSFNPPHFPPPYNSTYGPPPPVHGPYDHHRAPPPGPPSQYFPNDFPPGPNQPNQYPPSQYPPPSSYNTQHPYPSGPPPPYPPPPPQYANPPAPYGYNDPPPAYPPGDYGQPHRGPPPSHHQYAPSDSSRGQPHEDDRNHHHRGRGYQRHYDDRHSSETWHSPDAWHSHPPPVDQGYRDDYREDWHSRPSYRDDRSSRKRGHGRDDRRRDRHDRFHPYKKSDKSDRHRKRRQQSVTTQGTTPGQTAPSIDTGKPVITKADQDREPGEVISESASEHGDSEVSPGAILEAKDDEGYSWGEQTIFAEPPSTGKVDPISAPLPTHYSEDVMIPPAFDAKALISRYITPRNIDDFAQSIRETKDWQVLQYHPAFLDPGEVRPSKLADYNRAIQKDQAMRGNRRDRGVNSHDDNRQRYNNSYRPARPNGKARDSRYRPDHKKRLNDFPDDTNSYRSEKRHRQILSDGPFDRSYRPASPEPGEVVEADAEEPPYEPSETPIITVGASAPVSGPDAIKDTRSPTPDIKDIGYVPDQDIPRQQSDVVSDILDKPDVRPLTPPTLPTHTPPSHSRPSSRSPERSRPTSRRSSFGSNGSSLDDIERELLGLGGPPASGSDTERGSPKRLNGATPKIKRRKQPMVEAYSRRW